MNKQRKTGGFTLIELLIVIAILGILAAIAIPTYMGQKKKAVYAEAATNLQSIRLLEEQFYAENGRYAPDADNSIATAETAFYNAANDTNTNIGGAANIVTYIPFTPGVAENLYYDYAVTCPDPNAPDPNVPSFVAVATPKAGTIVEDPDGKGDFWINDRNERNF